MKRTIALTLLFFASVIVLALNKVADTDAWMHLSMGRLIWQTGGLPAADPYVFTNEGLPFTYSSWLFGLALYGIMQAGGTAGLVLAKAAVAAALFTILLRDALRPYRNHAVALAVLTVALVLVRSRFVERPDFLASLFLAFSIYSLNAFVREGRKYLYALPLVHLVWANVHSSINLMAVPFLAFLAGGVLQRVLGRRVPSLPAGPSDRQLRTIAVLFALSFAASLVSPYGIRQYLHGASFLSSSFFMQTITELRPPSWSTTVWPWTFGPAVLLSFGLNWRRFSAADALLVLPFLVLPFTAFRFIFLLGVVGGPVLARNLSGWINDRPWKTALTGVPAHAALAAGIVLTSALALANLFTVGDSMKKPGFSTFVEATPEKALAFMDGQGVTGRLFTILHWGGYILWRDYPQRTVYVDPRGAMPPDLFESLYLARTTPSLLDRLSQRFGFEAMLVDYPVTPAGVTLPDEQLGRAVVHPGWAIVYWDDLTLLYLKRGGAFDRVIREHEYRAVVPETGLSSALLVDPAYRTQAERELERNVALTGCSRGRVLLGNLYNETGRHREALEQFRKALEHPLAVPVSAYSGMGYALGRLGDTAGSLNAYLLAARAERNPFVLSRVGMLYYMQGDRKKAVRWLEEAVERNPDLSSAYPLLITAYRDLRMPEKAAAVEARRQARLAAGAGEEHFRRGLQAYSKMQLDEAASEFGKALAVNPSNPATWSNLGYVHYDKGDLARAFEHQRKALQLDPGYASAHYGLALIAKKRDDLQTARSEWEEYLRLEPEGYFSRKARQELKALESRR